MKVFICILTALLCLGCQIQKGWISDKIKTEYFEEKRVERDDQYNYIPQMNTICDKDGVCTTYTTYIPIYAYTIVRDVLYKNNPDFIIKIKNNNDLTPYYLTEKKKAEIYRYATFYITEKLFNDLQIGDLFDNKEYRFPCWDTNNERVVLREWKE